MGVVGCSQWDKVGGVSGWGGVGWGDRDKVGQGVQLLVPHHPSLPCALNADLLSQSPTNSIDKMRLFTRMSLFPTLLLTGRLPVTRGYMKLCNLPRLHCPVGVAFTPPPPPMTRVCTVFSTTRVG